MRRYALIAGLAVLTAQVAGCTSTAVKTFDAKMSLWTDSECSYAHVLFGDTYCRPRTVEREKDPVYCFRTLGGVDCYGDSDPYKVSQSGRALQPPPLAEPPAANAPDPPPATTAAFAVPDQSAPLAAKSRTATPSQPPIPAQWTSPQTDTPPLI
ncbi:MAG TPA: hypothetical protein VEU47_20590 [Candidatus Cybelea sp.]|nr:hypothetical protein [Candidatus Cybelea sp.]